MGPRVKPADDGGRRGGSGAVVGPGKGGGNVSIEVAPPRRTLPPSLHASWPGGDPATQPWHLEMGPRVKPADDGGRRGGGGVMVGPGKGEGNVSI